MTARPPVSDAPTAGALARLADEILPALIARLDVSDLGELEVRHDGWRVRLRRSLGPATAGSGPATSTAAPGPGPGPGPESARIGATSPAVGYYVSNGQTPVGKAVAAGDVVGWVDVLGVRQEVVSPRDGVVGRQLAEAGQAVEYGQELLVIDAPRRMHEAPAGDESAAVAD